MPVYTTTLPNGQSIRVMGPTGASPEAIQQAALQIAAQRTPALSPDSGERNYSLGTAASKGFSRGTERIKSAFGDVIPAMVGDALGFDEYAAKQMKEAQASQELVNRKYRAELQSYKDVQGIGDAIKFGIETVSEQIPNLATMVVPGIGAGQIARVGASKLAATELAKRQATAQGIGVYMGSYALNTPEVFQNIYDETGELATGTAILFGAAAAALDSVLPSAVLKNITPFQKSAIAASVLRKSGTRPSITKSVLTGIGKGSGAEGLTEAAQEAISISAENFVGNNPQIFDSEDWDRIMESAVRGAVAGGTFRGISEPFGRSRAEPKNVEDLTQSDVLDENIKIAATADVAKETAEENMKKVATAAPLAEVAKAAPAAEVTPKVKIVPNRLKTLRKNNLINQQAAQAAELGLEIQEDGTATRFETVDPQDETAGEQEVTYKIINNRWEKQDESTPIDATDGIETPRGSNEVPIQSESTPAPPPSGESDRREVGVDTDTLSPTGGGENVSDVALSPENITAEQQWDEMSVSGVPFSELGKEDQLRLSEARQDAIDEKDPSLGITKELVEEIDASAQDTFAGITFVKQENGEYERYKSKEGQINKRTGLPQGGPEYMEDFYRQAEMRPADDNLESRTDTEGTGQTAATITTDLVEEFGNNINKMIEKGKLVIVDNVSQLPANIEMSSTANGAYDPTTQTSYIVANRIQKGQGRRVLLHEIGEHYGLEKMVGKDYMPLLNRLKTLRKQNPEVQAIFDEVQELYPEFEVDSKPFLQEVMAKVGERAPNNTLFRRMVGAVKNFLRRLGLYNVNNFNDADIQDMILNSLRVSLAEATGTVTREQASGIPALQMSEDIEATAGVDVEQLRKLVGSNIYGKANTAAVTIKELLQNAADSLKGLLAKGTIEDGRIDITIGRPIVKRKYENVNRVISMRDNGTGMTPKTLSTTFITTGGSDKEANASGGLGVAKEQFLFGAKSVSVVTMRDGVITELVSTGEALNNSANNSISLPKGTIMKYSLKEYSDLMIEKEEARTGEKFRIYNNELNIDNFQPYMRLFPKGQGTIVEIEIPNFYREEDASGNVVEKEIKIEGFLSSYPELENSPLFATSPDGNVIKKSNIDVTFQGFSASKDLVPIGANFPTEDYATNIDVEFSWGSAKIIVSKEEVKYQWDDKNVTVLSNGLYQFEDALIVNPKEKGYGELIQRKFFIDIKSKIQPGERGYPFANNRQSFTPEAKKDLEKIENYVQKEFGQLQLTNQFNSIVNNVIYVLKKQKDGSVKRVEIPSLAKVVEKNAQDIIEETQDLKLTDAGDLVNRKTNVRVLTAKQMEEVQISAEGLQVEKGVMPTDEVVVIDNLETVMRDKGEDQPSVNLGDNQEYAPITQLAREKFGSRFDTFMNEIGEAFLLLRNQVIMLGNLEKGSTGKLPSDYNKLADNVVGVSFDVSFRGVNIGGVPFEGVFVNPGAVEFTNSPEEAGVGIVGTMIHELAHFYQKNHKDTYVAEYQRLTGQLEAAGFGEQPLLSGKKPKLRSLIATKKAVIKSIRDNEDIFKFLNSINQPGVEYEYGESKQQIRPIGERFETSDLEVRDERASQNMAKPSEKGRAGRRVLPGGSGKRDTAERREQQRKSVSPESKTTQESRVDNKNIQFSKEAPSIIDLGGVNVQESRAVMDAINPTIQNFKNADTAAGNFIFSNLSKIPDAAASLYVRFLSIPNKIELFGKQIPGLETILNALQGKANEIKQAREEVNGTIKIGQEILSRYSEEVQTEWNTILLELSRQNVNPETIINDPEARAELERPVGKDNAGNQFYNDKAIDLVARYEQLPKDLRDLAKLLVSDLKLKYDTLLETMIATYPGAEAQLRERFASLDYYLPMVRKGNFWFKYIDKNGEEASSSAETSFLRERMKKKLAEEGAKKFEDFTQAQLAAVSGRAPSEFVENLKAVFETSELGAEVKQSIVDTIEDQYLALFPEQSLRNQESHRRGVPGYINDVLFAYGETAPKIIASTANAKYNTGIVAAANQVSSETKDSTSAIVRAIGKDTINTTPFYLNPVANIFASMPAYLSYVWFIGGNISSAFVNLTQLPLIVLPFLQGEYGFDESQKALFDAIKMYSNGGFEENRDFLPDRTMAPFKKGKNGKRIYRDKEFAPNGKYHQLFKDAEEAAALRRGVGYEITELRKSLGAQVKSGAQWQTKAEAAVGYVFQNSERLNREVTLVAAFNLAKSKGMTDKDAIQKAIDLTSKVHSHALPEVGPSLFQDGLGKVTFVFKRFAQAQVYLVSKLFKDVFATKPKTEKERKERDIARNQLLGVYGYSFLMAGVQGMPFYGGATILASLLFDDEDDPFDPHTAVNQAIGNIAYRGPLSAVLGVDISQRTGFRDLVFREDPARLEKIGASAYMLEVIGGPGYSIARRGFEGIKMIGNGEIGRGAERILPTAVGNALKTVRYNTDGMTNRYGAPIIEGNPSVYESFMQILGFSNIELSEAYTESNALKGPERKLQKRRSQLLLQYFLAKQTGDVSGMKSIQKDINRFNSKAPRSFKLTPSVMNKSFKARTERVKNSVQGTYISSKRRADLEDKYLPD